MASIDNIVSRIARRLRRSAASGSNLHTEIIDELVAAQARLEEGPTLPWFLEHDDDITLSANDGNLGFGGLTEPNTFIRFYDDLPITYVDPTGTAVEPNIPLEVESELLILKQRYPGTGLVPKGVVLFADQVQIQPVPTQEITYTLHFYRNDPTVPAEGATTFWSTNFSNLLMNEAGKEIAWTLRDEAAYTKFEKDWVLAKNDYIKALAARENAGQVHVMGDP